MLYLFFQVKRALDKVAILIYRIFLAIRRGFVPIE